MTDRLSLTNALEAAGIERKAAERVASEIFDAINENVATKTDLAELRAAFRADIADLRTELVRWMFAQTAVIIGAVVALIKLVH